MHVYWIYPSGRVGSVNMNSLQRNVRLLSCNVDGKTRAVLIDTTIHYINTSPSPSSASNKKRNAMEHLFPGVDVPLCVDKSTNILEVLKLATRTFDQATITRASTRAYKESNHLRVD
ncbi:1272_t:CDS:2 [Ambispora gerdemannii]|uniref:1272_t:CDS:1 n=1 Tax=Ambispora gerdemannii TaxID=144530 RepID=A0A9N9HP78_9GLOM|nr:1272_t:CDS:2 [Ambispora gerdemannii]